MVDLTMALYAKFWVNGSIIAKHYLVDTLLLCNDNITAEPPFLFASLLPSHLFL
jgi:hypothetical protein